MHFQGQSWTIQCEIIQQYMSGAQPADEDQVPLDDPFEHDPLFDFFGLEQPANQDQFHQVQMAQLEEEQLNATDWGQ
jgi:hypothetical protein